MSLNYTNSNPLPSSPLTGSKLATVCKCADLEEGCSVCQDHGIMPGYLFIRFNGEGWRTPTGGEATETQMELAWSPTL